MTMNQYSIGQILRSSLPVVSVFFFFSVVLYLMGQPAWCSCGFKLVTLDAWGSESSQNFIDPYTTSHILHGIIFFALLATILPSVRYQWRMYAAMSIEIAWEILENSPIIISRYRTATASQGYAGDTILNSSSDLLFMLVGFWIASKFSWKQTLVFVVAVEILMLLLYRDNLTLNILMLLAPIDAIREWQIHR